MLLRVQYDFVRYSYIELIFMYKHSVELIISNLIKIANVVGHIIIRILNYREISK